MRRQSFKLSALRSLDDTTAQWQAAVLLKSNSDLQKASSSYLIVISSPQMFSINASRTEYDDDCQICE